MRVIRQLLTPARYLLIRADTADKYVIDWVLPACIAAAVCAGWALRPDVVRLTGTGGLVESVGALMQVLVGFYVASLAAVATFQGSSLDEFVLNMKLRGEQLKRRQFLSYLFGYLALLSLALYVLMLFRSVPVALAGATPGRGQALLKLSVAFVHQFVFWQMIFVTLLGLYYLTDRIHRSNDDAP